VALGILGMTEVQLYSTTPRTFTNILKGHHAKNQATQRREEERHRELMWASIMPHMDEANRKKPITALFQLPWDKEKLTVAKELQTNKQDSLKFWEKLDALENKNKK